MFPYCLALRGPLCARCAHPGRGGMLGRHGGPILPSLPHCTKSLRDSFGLTAFVLPEETALILRRRGRGRLGVCRVPRLTCGMERCTLCLIVEGACQYNPHIAQTVPHHFPRLALQEPTTVCGPSVQYILCVVRLARSAQGRVCPCTTHKTLSIVGKHRSGHVVAGTVVLGLVLDTLSGRSPLYRLEEFFAHQDTELLLGQAIPAHAFTDEALIGFRGLMLT